MTGSTESVVDRSAVEARLRAVADPCSIRTRRPMDIVDMGLIGDLEVDGGRVSMSLVLTDPTCIFAAQIIEAIERSLGDLDGVEQVDVRLDDQEIWTPDRMATTEFEAVKARLARQRERSPALRRAHP
jgi:metal-sulfur cluster biosynthetic enzyme